MARRFDVLFVCEECEGFDEIEATIERLHPNIPEASITVQLEMFKPFCCKRCGADDFAIQTWTEVK